MSVIRKPSSAFWSQSESETILASVRPCLKQNKTKQVQNKNKNKRTSVIMLHTHCLQDTEQSVRNQPPSSLLPPLIVPDSSK